MNYQMCEITYTQRVGMMIIANVEDKKKSSSIPTSSNGEAESMEHGGRGRIEDHARMFDLEQVDLQIIPHFFY